MLRIDMSFEAQGSKVVPNFFSFRRRTHANTPKVRIIRYFLGSE